MSCEDCLNLQQILIKKISRGQPNLLNVFHNEANNLLITKIALKQKLPFLVNFERHGNIIQFKKKSEKNPMIELERKRFNALFVISGILVLL